MGEEKKPPQPISPLRLIPPGSPTPPGFATVSIEPMGGARQDVVPAPAPSATSAVRVELRPKGRALPEVLPPATPIAPPAFGTIVPLVPDPTEPAPVVAHKVLALTRELPTLAPTTLAVTVHVESRTIGAWSDAPWAFPKYSIGTPVAVVGATSKESTLVVAVAAARVHSFSRGSDNRSGVPMAVVRVDTAFAPFTTDDRRETLRGKLAQENAQRERQFVEALKIVLARAKLRRGLVIRLIAGPPMSREEALKNGFHVWFADRNPIRVEIDIDPTLTPLEARALARFDEGQLSGWKVRYWRALRWLELSTRQIEEYEHGSQLAAMAKAQDAGIDVQPVMSKDVFPVVAEAGAPVVASVYSIAFTGNAAVAHALEKRNLPTPVGTSVSEPPQYVTFHGDLVPDA